MSRLFYLDFLRRVSPIQPSKNVANSQSEQLFLLLGSFDALRVNTSATNLQKIKKLHEAGHDTVDSVYDRQPMFLMEYNAESNSVLDANESIFSTKGEFANLPIIISILQIDKSKYANLKDSSVAHLISLIDDDINRKIELLKIEEQNEIKHWKVFWNLGEPDVVIVFRPIHLFPVAKVLHEMRIDSKNEVDIFSSCSHCGFPYQLNENSKPNIDLTKFALSNWIQSETDSNRTNYITLVNTSSGYHNLNAGKFIFGEWDYIINQDPEHMAGNLLQSDIYNEKSPYKTSYTLPAIELNNLGAAKGKPLEDNTEWINAIGTSFNEFVSSIEDLPYVVSNSTDLLLSLSRTVTGLSKFLLRLYLGRYEQDLYAYTKPVFTTLPGIVKNYQKQISYLNSMPKDTPEYEKGEIICRLIRELEEDTTNLVSSFQHLFGVLSISPHTFMETFGSNMRSLSAANKLVDAYQGLIAFLCKNFPDIIDEKTNTIGTHQILIIPHRKYYPKHTLFYRSSSPEVRISKIEMDFPKMFQIGFSVFIILHECAHHLGNRRRDLRWNEYLKACSLYAAESIIGESFLSDPLRIFISSANTQVFQGPMERAAIFYGIKDEKKKENIINESRDLIHGAAKDAIEEISIVIQTILESKLTEIKEGLKPNYGPHFQNQFYYSYALNLIEETFINLFPIGKSNIQDNIRNTLMDVINISWIAKIKKIAQSFVNDVIDNNGNQFEASRLLTKYKTKNIAADIVKNIPSAIHRIILMRGFGNLLNVFSDVYADVFAIQILSVSTFGDYCRLIQQSTGTAINQAVVSAMNLQRFAAIAKTCFNMNVIRGEGLEELIDVNNIPEWKQDEIRAGWYKSTGTSYFRCICNYANSCKEEMANQLTHLSTNGLNIYLDKLNNVFYKDNIDTEVEFIETFWKYLMEDKPCQ